MVYGIEHHMKPIFADARCTLLTHPRKRSNEKMLQVLGLYKRNYFIWLTPARSRYNPNLTKILQQDEMIVLQLRTNCRY